jgi:hypothetical protein
MMGSRDPLFRIVELTKTYRRVHRHSRPCRQRQIDAAQYSWRSRCAHDRDGDVLKVPTGALFRHGADWYGRHRPRTEGFRGRQTGLETEIQDGLELGTTVIVHPSDALTNRSRVRPR